MIHNFRGTKKWSLITSWYSTCAILTDMESVGLRELRQNASEIVRRVEAGATVTITVSGRPAAVLRGATARSWRRYEDIADLFSGPDDPHWQRDRALLDDTPENPWSR